MAAKQVELVEVNVWVMVNADGEYEVASDEDTLAERWSESDCQVGLASRMIQVKLMVPKPKATLVTATLPEEVADDVEAVVS